MAASSFCCLKVTQNCLNQTSKYATFLHVKFPHSHPLFVLVDFLGDALELNTVVICTCQKVCHHFISELAWYGLWFEIFGCLLVIRCSFLATESVNGQLLA